MDILSPYEGITQEFHDDDPIYHTLPTSLYFLSKEDLSGKINQKNGRKNNRIFYDASEAFYEAEKPHPGRFFFTVQEIPAIAFGSAEGWLIATQTNHKNPFKNYARAPSRKGENKRAKQCISEPTTLRDVRLKFSVKSKCWASTTEIKNRIVDLLWLDDLDYQEPIILFPRKLNAWQAHSNSSGDPLDWGVNRHNVSPTSTLRVIKNFTQINYS